ncbi:MAG: error-prone DNA polymerase [Beijerinckiaceae bacterium]
MSYAELAASTNFSFLRGASHPEEMVAQAMALGLAGIGIADRNSVAGVVRAHVFARENDAAGRRFRVLAGARLVFCDGTPDIIAYPRDRAAWGRLCRLLTQGNLRAEKGVCPLCIDDLLEWREGLSLIVMEESSHEGGRAPTLREEEFLASLLAASPRCVWLAARMVYDGHMRERLAARVELARALGLPLIAINDCVMHEPGRRDLADVVACIRQGERIEDAGARLLHANAERHIKPPSEMARLFAEAPDAVEETLRFLREIEFSLDHLRYEYPDELREGYASEQEALEAFAWEGARKRYPHGVPEKVSAAIRHELALVADLQYAAYFLTVHDIVRFARSKKILCQGRGSAANSTVCFCLGITEVDPTKHDLLFERFISAERREPPDIDVDFEHERREEVMQYIYARYGRERAGLTAAVVSYRGRSALREIGKVFGFEDAELGALSSTVWGGEGPGEAAARAGFSAQETRTAHLVRLAKEISGFPRHLSQHTGGFVITRSRLDEVVPVANAAMENRTIVEWDKDDLDALGILKIDILALGMLSCLRRGLDLLAAHYGPRLTLATIPSEEACVYDMICRADTIGVFQIESRAQMSMLPRLRPRAFYDLVIEVAIVRPGPIQGDMVHPYLRRRQGIESVSYPSKELEAVLGKTLGVPLFQEQAMKIAIVAADFTPSEADKLRRAMATFKRVGTIHTFRAKMIDGMTAKGYEREFAERCFAQIEGFGTYGFPESHAASFALLVYASCWLKCRYPDVFAAALLNSQPMGFYAPAQIVRDAREHGVEVREADVNFSYWDCTLEADGPQPGSRRIARKHAEQAPHIHSTHALRLGLRMVKGVREEDMRVIAQRRGRGYDSVRDVWLRTGVSPSVLELLAAADAFRSIGLDRREALWAVRGLNRSGDKDDLALWRHVNLNELEPDARLPPMPLGEHVVEDYRALSLSLKAHPVSFLRERLAARRILRCADLARVGAPQIVRKPGRFLPRVTVAGLVLVRQRPGSAKGVVFMTIEDETGVANAIVWPKVFEAQRAQVIGARFVAVTGRLQNEAGVIHVVAEHVEDLSSMLGLLSLHGGEVSALANADEVKRPQERPGKDAPKPAQDMLPLPAPAPPPSVARHPRNVRPLDGVARVMPRGRNFH